MEVVLTVPRVEAVRERRSPEEHGSKMFVVAYRRAYSLNVKTEALLLG